MNDWKAVKNMIEIDLDRIFWDEPIEVTMCKNGIFPSGASVDGQILGNLLFLIADTQAMGWKCAKPAVMAAIRDQQIGLEECKKIWQYTTLHIAKMLGNEAPPYCPAPWLNLPKVYNYSKSINEALPSIESKEELEDLLWSWFNYIDCLNRWFFLVFPWHLGLEYKIVTPEKISELDQLSKHRVK
jgi:hypothetical protein